MVWETYRDTVDETRDTLWTGYVDRVDDGRSTVVDAGESVFRDAIEPHESHEELTDHIREETGQDDDWDPEMEIVGFTDEDGERVTTTDAGDAYDQLSGDSDYSFSIDDVTDQVRDDAEERAGDIWDFVPLWAWILGGLVGFGALFSYTRPLWSIVGGVAS